MRPRPSNLLFLLFVGACDGGPFQSDRDLPSQDGDDTASGDSGTAAGDSDDDTDTGDPCPDGLVCVSELPYTHSADTRDSDRRELDAYACSPSTDESGPEVVYRVALAASVVLGVAIDDSSSGVDVDAHILTDLDADSCLDRGNSDAHAPLDAGYAYVVADTYVSSGVEQAGPFEITIGAAPLAVGDCSMESGWMDRVGDGGQALQMPATGLMALEAHLVTVDDGYGSSASGDWPDSITEGIPDHYATSQDATGFVMARDQLWAPQESCEYGQGACGAKLPVDDEGWYVNMYWSSRPDAGTRMILSNDEGRGVVVAAGYETGPGDLDYIGGTTEEVHAYLGSGHGSTLTLGFAVDQSLPLGPIDCD